MNRLTKIMFVWGFLLTSVWSHSSNLIYAQSQKFTFEFEQTTIKTIFQYIESHSEFIFMYRSDLLDTSKKVSVEVEQQTIEQILDHLLKGTSVTYEINDRQILLKKKDAEVKVPQQSGRNKLIQGFVKDEKGEPVIGATVKVKDATTGTTTDMDGLYNLTVPSENSVLVISYIGYVTQEVKVGKRQSIIIVLKEDTKSLDEVVITAYGTGQKKASMVGSVQTIRPTDLQAPTASISSTFAGRLAGVIAVQRGGQPGADGANFYIRGISTMSGATDPLIILDGVEISGGDLNTIDPEVIDGFSILKDATATAMYGTRGANGVMIITTKSGRNIDKPIINFRLEGSVSTPTSRPKFVDGATYMELFNEGLRHDGSGEQPYTAEEIAGTRAKLNPYVYPDVNWYDEMFKNQAFNQTFNVNIRGGGKRVDYFSSMTVTHQTGMLKNRAEEFFSYKNNINRMRYSFQNNINAYLSPSSRLSLRLNVQMTDAKTPNAGVGDLFSAAINTSPVEAPIYFPADGVNDHIKWGVNDRLKPSYQGNPVAELVKGYNDSFTSTVVAALDFEQKLDFFTKGLSFKALASFKNYSSNTNSTYANWNKYHLQGFTVNDGVYDITTKLQNVDGTVTDTALKAGVSNSGDRRFYLQASLNYDRTFGQHSVNAMFLYNQDEKNIHLSEGNIINALPYRKQGIAGRFSYSYGGKYLAEVNMGYNGSENFAKGHRWGFFPSVAVGYNVSEEEFFKPLKNVITGLKIRGSWGLVGNDNIGSGRFAYQSVVNLGGIGYTTGINSDYSKNGPTYARYANVDLTWEVGEKINIGMDMQLFRSLNLSVDVFRENRRDIFQERSTIPKYLGVTGTKVFGNYAAMKNQGVDLSIDYFKQFNKDWSVTMKGTFTYAHNEVTELDESPKYSFQSKVGQSWNMNGVLISDGLFIDQAEVDAYGQVIGGILGPGDIKYKNISKMKGYDDDVVDASDWIWAGNPTIPEIVYGFGPSFRWKNLDFSFFLQGVAKSSLMMSSFHPFGDESLRNVLDWVAEERWTEDNPNIHAAYPRITRVTSKNNTTASDYWLRNAAFLKLKNAEIGYTYKNMRFYVSGMNLLTFSPFKHWDPEMGGGNGLKYPTQRVFNIGFQMTINKK